MKELRADWLFKAGIPVLFIPGNAGNSQQMRSLGGEAARLLQGKNAQLKVPINATHGASQVSQGAFGVC